MFPLKQRKLIRGAAAHVAAGLGVGADYVASTGTPYFAAFDGVLSIPYPKGGQGGIWLRLTRSDGIQIEVAHLQKYVKSSGSVKEGELIAYTDNTGTVTTGPHAHIQIIQNGKRLDPEKFNWLTAGGSMSVRTELDKPALGKSKAMAFLNYEDNGDDINDYFNVQYAGKPLGDQPMTAFIDYMWKHPNRAKAMEKYKSQEQTIKNQAAEIDLLKKQIASGGSIDKTSIRDHANQIIKLVS